MAIIHSFTGASPWKGLQSIGLKTLSEWKELDGYLTASFLSLEKKTVYTS